MRGDCGFHGGGLTRRGGRCLVSTLVDRVSDAIRDIPDYPKPGILFKDITPVLAAPKLMAEACDWMAKAFQGVDVVVGMESRGFIFGVPVAERLGAAFVPARKE